MNLCYGANVSINDDIHETHLCVRFYTALGHSVPLCNSGRSQCWCASSPAGVSKATDQCSSCHDLASERSHVLMVWQCSVKLYSNVGAVWQVGRH